DGGLIVLDGRSGVHAYIKTHACRRSVLSARAAEHDAADTAVETIAQSDALGLRQGVLVEGIAGELQERSVDLRGKTATGKQVGVILLGLARGVVEPPDGVLLADVVGVLLARGRPDLVREGDVAGAQLAVAGHHGRVRLGLRCWFRG